MDKIVAKDVAKHYAIDRTGQLVVAVDGMDLGVRDGEFLCVVGPSGCGKSTFLQLVAGLEPLTGGSIAIDGRPVVAPGADRGMVFQSHALFPWRTVLENIEFGLEVKGVRKRDRRAVAD